MTHKTAVLIAVAVASLAAAVSTATAQRSATPTAGDRHARTDATAACAKPAVAAWIGGKSVCIRTGTACKAKYNRIYKKHGFTCIAGHLRKTPTAKPPPATTPDPPYTPPTGPVGTANTTVTVGLHDASDGTGYIELSQKTIPSGMVTFVITNYCSLSCSFDLQGVKASTIFTKTGQSETWTVALAPGTYRYHCDIDPTGMQGSFTVTS
jgi:plastocyanin